ncbi:GGDEF domain-containing protein [Sulfurivirga sp.]|uniref:GGDEF domain-containing protein n=1 Tax=Sulfurivirga sp. TaxID=2614236 RepID=UPI0025E42682|nr:GGDEF domain-containing protein [Sulfurivirga sp.]
MNEQTIPASLLLRCYQQAVSTLNHTLMQAETLEQFFAEVMTFVTTILNAERSAVQLCLPNEHKMRFFHPAHNDLLERLHTECTRPVERINDSVQLHFSGDSFQGHMIIHPVAPEVFELALDTLGETVCLTEHLLKARNEMFELRQREQLIDRMTLYLKTDPKGVIHAVSAGLVKALGGKRKQLIGQPLERFFTFDPPQARENPHLIHFEHLACTRGSTLQPTLWFQYWKSDLEDMFGQRWHFYLLDDITALIDSEEEAVHDPLTGLYNRRLFDELLEREINAARRKGEHFCLMLIDLDHFKRYNDTLGHPAGDRLLRDVARLIFNHFRRSSDLVFRIGGEELAVIYTARTEDAGFAHARALLEELRQRRLPHPDNPPEHIVTFTGGVICLPPTVDNPPDAETLYRQADQLLYEGKKQHNTVLCRRLGTS